jgi:hypothetical protein
MMTSGIEQPGFLSRFGHSPLSIPHTDGTGISPGKPGLDTDILDLISRAFYIIVSAGGRKAARRGDALGA